MLAGNCPLVGAVAGWPGMAIGKNYVGLSIEEHRGDIFIEYFGGF